MTELMIEHCSTRRMCVLRRESDGDVVEPNVVMELQAGFRWTAACCLTGKTNRPADDMGAAHEWRGLAARGALTVTKTPCDSGASCAPYSYNKVV